MKLTITLVLNVALIFAPAFASQDSHMQQGEWDQAKMPTDGWYKKKAAEISKEYPNPAPETLQNDKVAIRAAYPKVKMFYSDKPLGQSDIELLDIVGRAWSDFRKGDPNKRLTSDEFVRLAQEYGGLRIGSKPPGADIRVDDKPWIDPTNAEGAAHVGERVIRLSMAGFQEETGTVLVQRGQWTPFFRKLKKK